MTVPFEKPIEEMTLEEVQAERAQLAAMRAAKPLTPEASARLSDAIFADGGPVIDVPEAPAEEETPEPEPWPHQTITVNLPEGELVLEVRKPSEASLVAVTMSSLPGLTPQVQMGIFATFFTKHLSETSMGQVLIAMADPASGLDLGELIKAMASVEV